MRKAFDYFQVYRLDNGGNPLTEGCEGWRLSTYRSDMTDIAKKFYYIMKGNSVGSYKRPAAAVSQVEEKRLVTKKKKKSRRNDVVAKRTTNFPAAQAPQP